LQIIFKMKQHIAIVVSLGDFYQLLIK